MLYHELVALHPEGPEPTASSDLECSAKPPGRCLSWNPHGTDGEVSGIMCESQALCLSAW